MQMNLYSNIIVAIDLSEEALTVLSKAKALAEANNATLNICHVIEPLSVAYGANMGINYSTIEDQLILNSKKRVQALAESVNVPEKYQHIIHGIPEKEVHDLVKELDADLIVTGNHARHGFSLILGSTSSSLLHGSPCDVFTVRVGNT